MSVLTDKLHLTRHTAHLLASEYTVLTVIALWRAPRFASPINVTERDDQISFLMVLNKFKHSESYTLMEVLY